MIIKKGLVLVSLSFLMTLTSPLYAGTGSGKIIEIYVHEKGDNQGVVLFKTENNVNKAACSTAGNGNEWAVRLDTDQGKAMYSLLLSAVTTGKAVTIDGKGDCADWGDRERPKYIRVIY